MPATPWGILARAAGLHEIHSHRLDPYGFPGSQRNMNAGRIRSLAIVGVLLVAAGVLTKIAISDDKQSHTSYANQCPAGEVPIVTDPLPDYDQINLKLYNGS